MKKKGLVIARTGVISALYAVLSLVVFPLASGSVQVRLGEALCLLPLIFPESCVALFIGCIIVNILTGCAIYEVILGSLITFLSAGLTCFLARRIKNTRLKLLVGGSFPVFLNALLLPIIWYFCYGKLAQIYIIQALLVFLGQAVSVWGMGSLLYLGLERSKAKLL